MTEKQPELKSARRTAAETASDRTVVDTQTYEDGPSESTPPDSEPEFSPGKFSRIEIPLELRKEMLQAKLPRLAPEFFQDTVPPNQSLEAPPPASDEPAQEAKRRPPVALVVVCLTGAIFVLALALFRSFLGRPEPAPAPTTVSEAPAAPIPVAAPLTAVSTMPTPAVSQTPELIAHAPQPISQTAAPVAPKVETEPPHPAASARPKSAVTSKAEHVASSLPSTPSVPSPPPSTTATSSSWLNPR